MAFRLIDGEGVKVTLIAGFLLKLFFFFLHASFKNANRIEQNASIGV